MGDYRGIFVIFFFFPYFKIVLRHGQIVQLLNTVHDKCLSVRALRQIKKKQNKRGLYQKQNECELPESGPISHW